MINTIPEHDLNVGELLKHIKSYNMEQAGFNDKYIKIEDLEKAVKLGLRKKPARLFLWDYGKYRKRKEVDFSRKLKALKSNVVKEVIDILIRNAEGVRAGLVGGSVRDIILQRDITDIDVIVEGDGIGFANFISKKLKAGVKILSRYGTASISLDKNIRVDFATSRVDEYFRIGGEPEIRFVSIEEDLARRDFSVNAVAWDFKTKEIIDPFCGVYAIEKRFLHILSPVSFYEDPTRILRGIRLVTRLGFSFSEETLIKMREALLMNVFKMVEGHRILAELKLFLEEENLYEILRFASRYNIIQSIFKNIPEKNLSDNYLKMVVESISSVKEKKWLVLVKYLTDGMEKKRREDTLKWLNAKVKFL